MKLAIMQPYFFPYIGYFQLVNAVDEFIVYDNIKFTKKGWIHRNRILVNGSDAYFTLPLKKDSDYLNIVERKLAEVWSSDCENMRNRIVESYRKAPFFNDAFPVIEGCLLFRESNLFQFILNSLICVNNYLQIETPLIVSSKIPIDHNLKSEDKVLALCKSRKASVYINPIGGFELYSKSRFQEELIDLVFLKSDPIEYDQFSNKFIPFLSIIDVMMFNSVEKIREFLSRYSTQ